jgi:hypothetical protein
MNAVAVHHPGVSGAGISRRLPMGESTGRNTATDLIIPLEGAPSSDRSRKESGRSMDNSSKEQMSKSLRAIKSLFRRSQEPVEKASVIKSSSSRTENKGDTRTVYESSWIHNLQIIPASWVSNDISLLLLSTIFPKFDSVRDPRGVKKRKYKLGLEPEYQRRNPSRRGTMQRYWGSDVLGIRRRSCTRLRLWLRVRNYSNAVRRRTRTQRGKRLKDHEIVNIQPRQ